MQQAKINATPEQPHHAPPLRTPLAPPPVEYIKKKSICHVCEWAWTGAMLVY